MGGESPGPGGGPRGAGGAGVHVLCSPRSHPSRTRPQQSRACSPRPDQHVYKLEEEEVLPRLFRSPLLPIVIKHSPEIFKLEFKGFGLRHPLRHPLSGRDG